jgi:hypothetical protein
MMSFWIILYVLVGIIITYSIFNEVSKAFEGKSSNQNANEAAKQIAEDFVVYGATGFTSVVVLFSITMVIGWFPILMGRVIYKTFQSFKRK